MTEKKKHDPWDDFDEPLFGKKKKKNSLEKKETGVVKGKETECGYSPIPVFFFTVLMFLINWAVFLFAPSIGNLVFNSIIDELIAYFLLGLIAIFAYFCSAGVFLSDLFRDGSAKTKDDVVGWFVLGGICGMLAFPALLVFFNMMTNIVFVGAVIIGEILIAEALFLNDSRVPGKKLRQHGLLFFTLRVKIDCFITAILGSLGIFGAALVLGKVFEICLKIIVFILRAFSALLNELYGIAPDLMAIATWILAIAVLFIGYLFMNSVKYKAYLKK